MRRCFIPNHPEKVLPKQVERDQELLLEVLQRLLALYLVFGVKVVSMLQVLVVDQTSMPFVHRTSVVSLLTPMETTIYLLSLPPKQPAAPFLLRRLLALTLPPRRLLALTLFSEETVGSYLTS
ncbi:hypothetical protein Tco_0645980 [Tanacetum coccineum]